MLISKTKDELEELNIKDRTNALMEVKRVLKNKNIMVKLENKSKELELQLKRFNNKFNVVEEKELLAFRASNGKLIPLEKYQDQLCNIATDASKVSKVGGTISGEAFIEGLQHGLFIRREIHHLFLNKPNFETCIEVDERFRSMVNFYIPSEE